MEPTPVTIFVQSSNSSDTEAMGNTWRRKFINMRANKHDAAFPINNSCKISSVNVFHVKYLATKDRTNVLFIVEVFIIRCN